MFRLIFAVLALMFSLFWRPDEGDGDGDGSGDGDGGGEEDGDGTPYRRLEFKTKEEEEAHYNSIFSERDGRIRKNIREEEQKALLEKLGVETFEEVEDAFGEYQELQAATETESERVKREEEAKKEARKQRDAIKTERDTLQERVDTLEGLVKSSNAAKLERVPEVFRPFVENMTAEDQAKWFEDNEEKLTVSGDGEGEGDAEARDTRRARGSRRTGGASRKEKNGSGAGNDEVAERARQNQRRTSTI